VKEADGGALPEEGLSLIEAIGHPTRAKILAVLSDRTASAKEIADEIAEPVGRVRRFRLPTCP
jgi:DNA-binding transcriptional ArsR family regulator